MSEHPAEERLNDWVDGLLEPTAAADVEAHVSACAECRAAVEKLNALLTLTAQLPVAIEPPAGTWEGIAARTVDLGRLRREVLQSLRIPLAAAALVLVTLGAGATALLLRSTAADSAVATNDGTRETPSVLGAATLVVAEDTYQREFDALIGEFRSNRSGLDSATVAVVEENLNIIQQALNRAHAALVADPANRELPLLITDTHRKRIEIVERALRLSARSERSQTI
jgi:hypothetical protein